MIHRGVVPPEDWEERESYRVTAPLRTLLDIAASPASWPYLESAVRDALRRGLVSRRQLLATDLSADAQTRLAAAMQAAERQGPAELAAPITTLDAAYAEVAAFWRTLHA